MPLHRLPADYERFEHEDRHAENEGEPEDTGGHTRPVPREHCDQVVIETECARYGSCNGAREVTHEPGQTAKNYFGF